MRWTVALALAPVAMLAPLATPSSAQADGPGVVVRPFSGQYGSRARSVVVKQLRNHGVELVPNGDATRTAGELGVELGSADGYAEVAQALNVKAFIEGRMQRGRRGWRIQLRVREGMSGEVVDTATMVSRSAGGLASKLRSKAWNALSSGLDSAQAPEGAAPADDALDMDDVEAPDEEGDGAEAPDALDDEVEEPSDDAAGAGELDALRLMAGLQVFSRKMSYKDDILGGLREYNLGLGPAAAVSAEWYPGAHFTDGIAAAFGLQGRFAYAFGLESSPSRDDGNTQYDTSSMMYEIGARARHAVGIAELHLDVAYGKQVFEVDGGEEDSGLPKTSYGYIRLGGGSAFDISERFGMDVHLAYLKLSSLGELGSDAWFPRASGGGVLAQLGMDIGLGAGFSVRVQGEMQRYFFSLSPEPGDPHVAGGMLDQYLSGTVGIGYRH